MRFAQNICIWTHLIDNSILYTSKLNYFYFIYVHFACMYAYVVPMGYNELNSERTVSTLKC